MLAALTAGGLGLWMLHADAFDLGRRSPILDYDSAQYAVAARELARHQRLATIFVLPIEIAAFPVPPWPIAGIQPGLVILEAGILRLLPDIRSHGRHAGPWARPDQQEWPLIVIPVVSFLMIGASLGLATRHLMGARNSSGSSQDAGTPPAGGSPFAGTPADWRTAAAGLVLGATFLLDPEAQHLAAGPSPEMPFTFGLIGAMAALALNHAGARPFLFGLLLGIAGSFAASMQAFAPLLAGAAALTAPRGRRGSTVLWVLGGFAIPLAPWWFYQWSRFGSPAWHLTRYVLWDGIQGRTWFSLYHLPGVPDVPHGYAAISLLAAKIAGNLPGLVLDTMTGPRALWVAALILWAVVARPPRSQRIAGLAVIAIGGVSLIAAAATLPRLRYVFPARVLTECGGILACWGLLARAAELGVGAPMRRVAAVFVAVLALGWGGWQTARGLAEARAMSHESGTPSTLTLLQISVLMNREVTAGEPVMSNLGPELAWHARRPVIHLALRPEDVAACRQKTEFRTVILVFRDASRAWPGWQDLFSHPIEASHDPALGIQRARVLTSGDGFTIVWLDLAPPEPKLAAARNSSRVDLALAAIRARRGPRFAEES